MIEKVLTVVTLEEAECDDAAYWATQSPSQRLAHVTALRESMLSEVDQRIVRVLSIIEVP